MTFYLPPFAIRENDACATVVFYNEINNIIRDERFISIYVAIILKFDVLEKVDVEKADSLFGEV